MRAKVNSKDNVRYRIFDKDGNIKNVFNPNKIFALLIKKGLVS